ncbi:universal stress protein [Aeromonas allosaccharophila]
MRDNIMLMLQGVDGEYSLFQYATALAKTLNGKLTLVHVILNQKENARILNVDIRSSISDRERAIRQKINEWRLSTDIMPEIETLLIDNISNDLQTLLEQHEINLLVIGHHQHLIDYSLATQLIKTLRTPVLVYPLDKYN